MKSAEERAEEMRARLRQLSAEQARVWFARGGETWRQLQVGSRAMQAKDVLQAALGCDLMQLLREEEARIVAEARVIRADLRSLQAAEAQEASADGSEQAKAAPA